MKFKSLISLLLVLSLHFSAKAQDNKGPSQTNQTPILIKADIAQLFVDDFLIEIQTHLLRTLHQPKKDDDGNVPIIALENEYGGTNATLEANGTIVYDSRLKKFVIFAIAYSSAIQGEGRVRLYRFTSPDAMRWIKGDDGMPQPVVFDMVDKASGRKAAGHDLFSCYYDSRDAEYPYQGWLYYWNWEELEGLYFVRSKDGKNWERGPMVSRAMVRQIVQDGRTLGGPADVTIFSHDKVTDQFLASIKFYSLQTVGEGNYLRSRAYTFVRRLDEPLDMNSIQRVALVPAAAAINGDRPHDEFYGSTAWHYESLWLGGLKVWHGGGDYSFSAAGCAFLKLAVSRDGLTWKKVQFTNDSGFPEVFIPNGKEGGNNGRNDGGYMTEFSQGPLRIGDELIFYYGSSSYGKKEPTGKRVSGGGIFRARLRPDGFVSVDGGTLTTKTMRFEGTDLMVNGVGPITIALLDDKGKVLGTSQVKGDSLRHKILFNGKSLGKKLREKVVRLQFTIGDGGHLYSFQTL